MSRIPRIKDAKFFGYYFYMNTSIEGDFQIYISVPLITAQKANNILYLECKTKR